MTLSISITPEAEARLRERAAACGQPLDVYAARVLEQAVTAPTLDELLAPARRQVAATGMTDREFDDLVNELRDEVWREKQGQLDRP
jgi:hypothetical protein